MADATTTQTGEAPWPLDVPEAYNQIQLGARVWPGVAKVKVKRGQKIDKKTAKGQHSAKLTFNGRNAAEVEIDHIFGDWGQADELQGGFAALYAEYLQAIDEVEVPDGKDDPKPLQIVHPIATIRKLKAIAVDEVDGPEWDEKNKWFHLKIKATEYENPPPTNATTTPDSADGGTPQYGTVSYTDGSSTVVSAMQDKPTAKDPSGKAHAATVQPPDDNEP